MANAKLGWNQEGNWAPPLVYVIFALIAPISGVMMLVFMYLVVKGDATQPDFLAFLLAGSAMFLFIRLVLTGAGFAVVEDREHYKMLRYVYITPTPFAVLIAGRIGIKLLIAMVGMVATILAGHFFLNVPLRTDGVLWAQFIGSLFLGLIGLGGMGIMLASMMLLVDRMGWIWAEGVAGLLFLTSGAIIPLSFLPAPMAFISQFLPMTYWADIWRLSLYGDFSTLAQPEMAVSVMWSRMAILTVAWCAMSYLGYKKADAMARRSGKVEQETFY